MKRRLALTILALLSLACANGSTLSESQCTAGDWQTIGYRDGALGFRNTHLLAHQDACVKHGVVPERDEYLLGWRDGIEEFCDPDNGFQLGWNGQAHNNVCPKDLHEAFLGAYKEGHRLFRAEARVIELEKRIQKKRMRLQIVKEKIATATTTAQLGSGWTPTKRIEHAARMKRLDEDRRRLEVKIPWLESELTVRAGELEDLSSSVAAVGF